MCNDVSVTVERHHTCQQKMATGCYTRTRAPQSKCRCNNGELSLTGSPFPCRAPCW